MRYRGSKSRLSKYLVPIIQNEINTNCSKYYLEPFVGGANISDKYTILNDPNNSWEQSGLKITGDAVWGLTTMFFNDWMYSNGKLIGDVINYKTEKYSKLK